jgi:hypothetical protein
MALEFTPKTEKEILEENLWPEGDYSFTILTAAEKLSKKSQSPMIELTLEIYNDEGKSRKITDYLMVSGAWKLRKACEACGLLAKYEMGSLEDYMFTGKSGILKLNIQKDTTGQYPDKNSVASYVVPKIEKDKKAALFPKIDDEIPDFD